MSAIHIDHVRNSFANQKFASLRAKPILQRAHTAYTPPLIPLSVTIHPREPGLEYLQVLHLSI